MLEIDGDRRQLMTRLRRPSSGRNWMPTSPLARRVSGCCGLKVAAAGQVAERTKNVADRGYRSGDYRDDAQIRLAEAEAEMAARAHRDRSGQASTCGGGQRRLHHCRTVPAPTGPTSSARRPRPISSAPGSRSKRRSRPSRRPNARWRRFARTYLLQSKAAVKAPTGATIRSLVIGAGATVVPGEAVAPAGSIATPSSSTRRSPMPPCR